MSAVRAYGPDGSPLWVPVDGGAVGRIRHSRAAISARGIVVTSIVPVHPVEDDPDEATLARREQLREASRRYRARRRRS